MPENNQRFNLECSIFSQNCALANLKLSANMRLCVCVLVITTRTGTNNDVSLSHMWNIICYSDDVCATYITKAAVWCLSSSSSTNSPINFYFIFKNSFPARWMVAVGMYFDIIYIIIHILHTELWLSSPFSTRSGSELFLKSMPVRGHTNLIWWK